MRVTAQSRALERAINQPQNKWEWYEVAKNHQVQTLEELIGIALEAGITDLTAVKEGYEEYKPGGE